MNPTVPNQALAEHAAAIRELGKKTVENIIEIGRHLTECKKLVGHGNWLPWLEREFGWSDRTALNFMRVAELSKSETVSNLNLPVKALYLLAAPSTPREAVDEVVDRAQAGEPVSVAETKHIIEEAKGRQQPSSRTGKAVGVKRKKRSSQEVRLEEFFNSLLFVATACTAIVERDIPDLNNKQQDEVIAQLKEASAALSTFGKRFKNNNEKASKSGSRCSICREIKHAPLRPVFICDDCVNIHEIREATTPPNDDGLTISECLRREKSKEISL